VTRLLLKTSRGILPGAWLRRLGLRLCELFLVILVLVCPDSPLAHGTSLDNNEYAVKAAFLFHFAQLTNWPSDTFQHPDDPLTFCTTGKDPFNGALEMVLAGKTVKGHAVRIAHLKQLSGVHACQVLFVGILESSHLAVLLANLQNLPILTTGEADDFTQQGGMIGFRPEQERLRFEINVAAAEKCNLSFSSELLSLAKAIIPGKANAASH
jgi:uncharacterized protein DUF4154